ncbi:flagellar assembly protein T N-terminal domain-containing protein [Alteromonas halophila]|uniref:Flagellar biosynthesis protein FlgT n=1 Tax=Alteromonas halophila TaxID=516698 RepID=A0A918JE80_9ALTE|nr:flagellar assembly protein T N-terminal domain-containing protein [Alteromonas halophila]GGW73324.1 hypothetical protein GCM10007391_01160 [Alteromonas halophila]
MSLLVQLQPTLREVARLGSLRYRLSIAILWLFLLPVGQVSAAWYEAKGQALIIDGDKPAAREAATQEAIKQAMLFAGASVRSVQTLTNGLLGDDRLQISSSGEVEQLELVNEVWHNDYVSVTIRADIFPKTSHCSVAAYPKNLSTTVFPVRNAQHLLEGQIKQLPDVLVSRLQRRFQEQSESIGISYIAPYTAQWSSPRVAGQAPALARQTKTQYVIAAEIDDVSVERHAGSALRFWEGERATRYFRLSLKVIDGMNGGTLLNKQYQTQAPWKADRFTNVDVTSSAFWHSPYGDAVDSLISNVVTDVTDALACQPLTGRVIEAQGEQLQVSIGRDHGLQKGDELYVYKSRQVIDAFGQTFLQYNVYPGKVQVVAAYADNATVEAVEGTMLGNIQPNDFVARR